VPRRFFPVNEIDQIVIPTKYFAMQFKDLSKEPNGKCQMINTFSELIKERKFFIPDYQRAYSWKEEQVSLFIADMAEHTKMAEQSGSADKKPQYYLGHYILEANENGKFAIVDGQQRLTTVAIFLAVCQFFKNSSNPLLSLDLEVVKYDNKRFREILLPGNLGLYLADQEPRREDTASLKRVVKAIHTFHESFLPDKKQQKLFVDKIDAYLDVISRAAVSVGIYYDKAVAAQIFELTNTRGVLLTETEKVKALLMKYVYLNSEDKDHSVGEIQESFAEVFKLEERAADASFRGEMSLDDILAHHLRAIDDGEGEPSFKKPQNVEGKDGCLEYVRTKLKSFDAAWPAGVKYAKDFASQFAGSMKLVSVDFVEQDKEETLIGDVILLDQRRSMIFLLRYFRVLLPGQIPDHALLKRWESFLFLWDFHDVFSNMKSPRKESFQEIFTKLNPKDFGQVAGLLAKYYSGETNFAYRPYRSRKGDDKGVDVEITGLAEIFRAFIAKPNIEDHLLHRAYEWPHWHPRYKYWLYKHEIDKAGADQTNQVRVALRALFKDNAATLDHIVPHGLDWRELSEKMATDANIDHWEDESDKDQARKHWKSISETINGIGNLLLLSHSDNSSIQNSAPSKRAAEYKKRNLDSVSYREVKEWKDRIDWSNDNSDSWQARIKARGEHLIKWMEAYFTDKATWPTNCEL
jgi:hypothetical protein